MNQQQQKQIWSFLSLAALLGTLVVNALANALPINGITTGDVSSHYPNLFVPAGFTFSIWGVIYLLLITYVVYMLTMAFRKGSSKQTFIPQSAPWFILSSLANMGWILAWHHLHIGLSVILMFILLGSLLILYLKIGIGIKAVPGAERRLVHLPFSVYLGWITVATIANITAWLVSIGWSGWGVSPFTWTSVMILTAGVIGLMMLYRRKEIWFNLVILWAIGGIIARQAIAGETHSSALIIIAAFVALNLIVNGFIMLMKKRL